MAAVPFIEQEMPTTESPTVLSYAPVLIAAGKCSCLWCCAVVSRGARLLMTFCAHFLKRGWLVNRSASPQRQTFRLQTTSLL